ncbi:hypothetical protein [Micromonospora sp. NPDC003776]
MPAAGGVTMAGGAGSRATRELLLVLAIAGVGLVLAMVAAFAPWHLAPAPAGLVGLHPPAGASGDASG